jgi:c(7)-type cytochrome triheme protein
MRMRTLLIVIVILAMSGLTMAQTGVKKRRPLPNEYGRVVLNNHSEKAGLAPVVFDHWLHRAKFTCRLCHVDMAFAMKAGTTGVTASDNVNGLYCGSCHNGRMVQDGKRVFESCSKTYMKEDMKKCERCHSLGKNVKREYDFAAFTERLPKERFGNGINWEKAEEDGLIKLTDSLGGISIPRKKLTAPKDLTVEAKQVEMPEIIFSHKKHAVWNGCELCHPEIFGVKKGTTKYTMSDIFEGRYCGVCHDRVAFPNLDCQRCHTKPV